GTDRGDAGRAEAVARGEHRAELLLGSRRGAAEHVRAPAEGGRRADSRGLFAPGPRQFRSENGDGPAGGGGDDRRDLFLPARGTLRRAADGGTPSDPGAESRAA